MKRYTALYVPFEKKDILKTALPSKGWQRWKFKPQTKEWILTLQTAQSTKTFEDNLIRWTNENGIYLSVKEWDGSQKENNYE